MPLEQQIACIIEIKAPTDTEDARHEQASRDRPIEALGSADVLARWCPAYTSHSSGFHRLFITWHIQDRYHDYYYH